MKTNLRIIKGILILFVLGFSFLGLRTFLENNSKEEEGRQCRQLAMAHLQIISDAIRKHESEFGEFSSQELCAFIRSAPNLPKTDPWGRPYEINIPQECVFSFGPPNLDSSAGEELLSYFRPTLFVTSASISTRDIELSSEMIPERKSEFRLVINFSRSINRKQYEDWKMLPIDDWFSFPNQESLNGVSFFDRKISILSRNGRTLVLFGRNLDEFLEIIRELKVKANHKVIRGENEDRFCHSKWIQIFQEGF